MGIFYYMGFFEAFLYFCKRSTHCKTYCGENNCILFSYPAYDVEIIKTYGKIDLKIKLPGQDGGHSKKLHEIKRKIPYITLSSVSSESVDSLALNLDLLWDTDNFDKVSLLRKHR